MDTLADLKARRDALDKEISERLVAEKTEAVEKVRSLMKDFGLTLADVASAGGKRQASAERKPRGPQAGVKVAPKYRDENGNTWSGRGLKPKWLQAAIDGGKTLADFAV